MAFGKNVDHWSPLKCNRLTLWGDKWPDGKGTPSCSLVITTSGNAKFVIYKNTGTDSAVMNFSCGDPASPLNLYQVLVTILDLIDEKAPEGVFRSFQSKSWFAGGRERLDKPKTMHNISVIRDNKGRVCLSFQARNEEPVIIPFKNGATWVGVNGAGEKLSEKEDSEIAARSWAKMYEKLISEYIMAFVQKPEDKGGQNNNSSAYSRNSSNNNSGGSSGGNSGGFSDYDDVE